MQRFKILLGILTLALSCGIAVVFGAGNSYHAFLTPRTSKGEFYKIDSDGWIESRSVMSFRSLLSRGNRLVLRFKDWHPEGVSPASLRFFRIIARTEVLPTPPFPLTAIKKVILLAHVNVAITQFKSYFCGN